MIINVNNALVERAWAFRYIIVFYFCINFIFPFFYHGDFGLLTPKKKEKYKSNVFSCRRVIVIIFLNLCHLPMDGRKGTKKRSDCM